MVVSPFECAIHLMAETEEQSNSPRVRRKNSTGMEETIAGSPTKWLPLRSPLPPKDITLYRPATPGMQKVNWHHCTFSPSKKQSPLGSSLTSKHQESTLRRRKESLAGLGLDLMTTVQECPMDSPTIPGHPPIKRNLKQAVRMSPQKPSPQPSLSQMTKAIHGDDHGPYLVPRSVFSNSPGTKRASSVLLPNGLAPLVIPDSSTNFQSVKTCRSLSSTRGDEDLPPKVPPKSPKTLIRAFPQPGKVREIPTSGTSPFSAFQTANSSMTSLDDSRNSPKPWASPVRGRSPLGAQKSVDAISGAARSLSMWKKSEPTLINEKIEVHLEHAPLEYPVRGRLVMGSGHQRAESEASILNRARPIRRGNVTLKRSLSRSMKFHDSTDSHAQEIPVGIQLGIARDELGSCEIRRLKQLAQSSVKDFRVLSETDVLVLTRELGELEERCEYLKRIHLSLRQSRVDLHSRMVGVLKSPRTATFSREHLIRQEEALLDLDISINEWLVKLNLVETRRQKVQQKLLEHTAAVIYMTGPASPRDELCMNQQTPPRSPQRIEFGTERREVESIRIYADSGVASLLASIEQELGVLAGSTRYEGF